MRPALLLVALVLSCAQPHSDAEGDDRQAGDANNGQTATGQVGDGQAGDNGPQDGAVSAPPQNGDGGTNCISDGDPFDTNVLRDRVTYLASPELGGRVPGTAGDKAARALVANRFRCLGLTPGGKAGSYELPFVNRAGTSTANVVGYVRGSDPAVASDIIVIGAHQDHFGTVGGKGLRLGANDNASGVAGLLAVAQAIRQRKIAPRRTIAFVAFGSEETLTTAPYTEGSALYVGKGAPAALPMEHVVYMINFDMIGTYSQEKLVYAIGSLRGSPAHSTLSNLTKATPEFKVSLGESGEEGDSDFYPFCTAGVPYVFFWTSDNPCYHKSCDTPDRLDYPHLSQIAHLAADLTASLGDSTTDLAGFRSRSRVSDLGCTDD